MKKNEIEKLNAYDVFTNELKNNMLSHAYLINENNNKNADQIATEIVKDIFCYGLSDNIKISDICKKIESNNYLNYIVIKPDGFFIKKNQILELEQDINRTSLNKNKIVYLIKNLDRMKDETANSMLKFLEEPNDNVVGILMTNEMDKVLPTIKSRCQILSLENNLSNDEFQVEEVVNFVENIEKNGLDVFLTKNNFWYNRENLKSRDELEKFHDILINIYFDILISCSKSKAIKYDEFYDVFVKIANYNNNDGNKIMNKLNFLLINKKQIKNNINYNLLIDNIIINLRNIQ